MFNHEQTHSLKIIACSQDVSDSIIEGNATKSKNDDGAFYRFHQNVRFAEQFILNIIHATVGY